jgi:hypothetical protein
MGPWEYLSLEWNRFFGEVSPEMPAEGLQRKLDGLAREGWEVLSLSPATFRRGRELYSWELVSVLICLRRRL